jgi:uncharacterized NAD-dependent epimerase/dehydratase family protein
MHWVRLKKSGLQVSYTGLIENAGINGDMIKSDVDEAIGAGYNIIQSGRAKSRGQNTISAMYKFRWDDSGE